MIPDAPTESSVKAVLQELPRVHTRDEALQILTLEIYNEDGSLKPQKSIAGLVLSLAVERGIYPDKLKVL